MTDADFAAHISALNKASDDQLKEIDRRFHEKIKEIGAVGLPIVHKACGWLAMWWVGEHPPRAGDSARSADVEYLDGTKPKPGEEIAPCPHCGLKINVFAELQRFDEKGRAL